MGRGERLLASKTIVYLIRFMVNLQNLYFTSFPNLPALRYDNELNAYVTFRLHFAVTDTQVGFVRLRRPDHEPN